jgi:hypothetical protein
MHFKIHNNISKVCALIAATLVLPALAYADHDGAKGEKGNKGDKDPGDKHIPVVPEANAAWVLVPFFGAVLLLSWREFSRAKA